MVAQSQSKIRIAAPFIEGEIEGPWNASLHALALWVIGRMRPSDRGHRFVDLQQHRPQSELGSWCDRKNFNRIISDYNDRQLDLRLAFGKYSGSGLPYGAIRLIGEFEIHDDRYLLINDVDSLVVKACQRDLPYALLDPVVMGACTNLPMSRLYSLAMLLKKRRKNRRIPLWELKAIIGRPDARHDVVKRHLDDVASKFGDQFRFEPEKWFRQQVVAYNFVWAG